MMLVFCLRILIVVCGVLFTKVGLYALIMAYARSSGSADAETIFYIVSIFGELREAIGVYIPYGIGAMAEFYSAMTRVSNVINGEELPPNTDPEKSTARPFFALNVIYRNSDEEDILKNVTVTFNSGLTMLTGAVGSGKTYLLKTILREYPATSALANAQGRISYASQDPWLFPASIRQNILFGEPFVEKK